MVSSPYLRLRIGAGFTWKDSLSISISIVIASSVSMGLSEFLCSKAHKEYMLAEKRKGLWEFKNFREQEIQHVSIMMFFMLDSYFYNSVRTTDDRSI